MSMRFATLTTDLRVAASDVVCIADVAAASPRVIDASGELTAS
jgi:hypothetical protein